MSENYSQPDFYHFNEDSIKLVKWIQSSGLSAESILDLGAGSGIIGIELAKYLKPKTLMLVELQKEFIPHLEKNCEDFLPKSVSFSIILKSFQDFNSDQTFDLIVCNPPYYLPGEGELPKNPNRAIARAFLTDSWPVLLDKINSKLSAGGKGYIVLKNNSILYESVNKDAALIDLVVEKYDIGAVMILELFRLNEYRD
jgi:tRNA1Val (adenine37-N6)-methyltransferase